jgi:hypothetical protein
MLLCIAVIQRDRGKKIEENRVILAMSRVGRKN